MTSFSAFHIALCGFCAFMALLHAGLSRIIRAEKSQVWASACFASMALIELSVAGASVAARGSLGPPGPWAILAAAVSVPGFVTSYGTVWSVIQVQVNTPRRILLAVSVLCGVVTTGAVIVAVARSPQSLTYEAVFASAGLSWYLPGVLATLACGLVWILEGVLALRRARPNAWLIVGAGSVGFAITAYSAVAHRHGGELSPTWFGGIGVLFTLFASAASLRMLFRTVQLTRDDALAGYRIVRRLASGGMGELYLGTRIGAAGFQRLVAIKKMKQGTGAADLALLGRFLAEGRMAAKLSHPNVVAVHDLGRAADGWFIAMEYVAGVSLQHVLSASHRTREPVPIAVAVAVVDQACRALAHAHAHGIVHRDVKPANVMLSFEGVTKLVDFGIAKDTASPEGSAPVLATPPSPSTQVGELVGTLLYMSPERLRGQPALPTSDLYALGAVLYELIAGVRMVPSDTDMARVVSGKWRPQPVAARRPDVSADLAAVVQRAIAPEPEARFASADAFANALEPIRQATGPVDLAGYVRRLFPREWAECGQLLGAAPAAEAELPTAPAQSAVATRSVRGPS